MLVKVENGFAQMLNVDPDALQPETPILEHSMEKDMILPDNARII